MEDKMYNIIKKELEALLDTRDVYLTMILRNTDFATTMKPMIDIKNAEISLLQTILNKSKEIV